LHPVVALWIPNVVLAMLGGALLLRAARQNSLASVAAFDRWVASWRARWESRVGRHAES